MMWEQKRPDRPTKSGSRHRCKACRGTGQVPGIRKTMGIGMGSAFGVCPDCDGTGWIDGDVDVQPDHDSKGGPLH